MAAKTTMDRNVRPTKMITFPERSAEFMTLFKKGEILKPYVPSQNVQNELNKISDRLRNCTLYDDYRQRKDIPMSNTQIDAELAKLIAAEEEIKRSRQNFRRAVKLVVLPTGPSEEEKHELRKLMKNPVQRMYDTEDFMRDFDTMPYVATKLVDLSLERIEKSIQKRQLALQNLRIVIYEASVSGYCVEARVSKKTRSPRIPLETSKDTPNSAEVKVPNEKRPKHADVADSDSEEDVPFSEVMQIYQAESLRLEKNLTMFLTQFEELLKSKNSVKEVKKVKRVRFALPDKEERRRKNVSHPPRDKTQTSRVKEKKHVQVPKKKKETNGSVSAKSTPSRKEKDCAAKQKLVMQPSSDEEDEEDSDDSDDDFPQELPVQPVTPQGRDIEITKEPKAVALNTLRIEVDGAKEPEEVSPRTSGSNTEVTTEPVILTLPTLDPMPVYIDNFQASCVLTHLYSSSDDYDEDFEPDYVIPPFENERTVYTGKQHKVYSRLSKKAYGRKERC